MEQFYNLIFNHGGCACFWTRERIGGEFDEWSKIDIDYVSNTVVEALYEEYRGVRRKIQSGILVGSWAVAKENSEDWDIHFYFVREAIEANSEVIYKQILIYITV